MVDGVQQNMEFDEEKGKDLRDEAIRLAVDHAERHIDGWKEAAYFFILKYPSDEFTNEEVRKYAYENKLPKPPDCRSWGGIIRKARKSGVIEFVCYGKAKNPLAHNRPAAIWKKTGKVVLLKNLKLV